jgi:hypothetical protein
MIPFRPGFSLSLSFIGLFFAFFSVGGFHVVLMMKMLLSVAAKVEEDARA